jgi:glycosyltransferase involved in cell wall biosynthesis
MNQNHSSSLRVLTDGRMLPFPHGTGLLQYLLAVWRALDAASHSSAVLVETHGTGNALADAGVLSEKKKIRAQFLRTGRRMFQMWTDTSWQALPMNVRSDAVLYADIPEASQRRFYALGGIYADAKYLFGKFQRTPQFSVPDDFDVWHATMPIPLKARGVPRVTTIHDIIPLRVPSSTSGDKKAFYELIRANVEESRRVIAVSEQTRRDLVEFIGADDKKIRVVYSTPSIAPGPGDPRLQATVLKSYGLREQGYILFLANIEPRKNVGRLIDAYLSLETDIPLVIAGRKAWMYEESLRRLEQDENVSARVRLLGFVPDEYRESLYRGALFFAFPSLYEGFGIPILDALVCGCPVVVSDIGPHREICGSAAVYVDPANTGSIAEGLERLLKDEGLRRELVSQGKERAQFFSVERHAAGLTEVYREARNGG